MTTNSDDTNVANNVVQPKVQDLTEQWKKGELEQGWYYIECIDLPERWIDIDYYRNDCYEDEGFCKGFFDHNDWRGIDKVLAPVPSYEEWRRLQSSWVNEMGKAVDLQKALEWSNEQYNTKVPVLESENQQLKELLKECRTCLKVEYTFSASKTEEKILSDILYKINKAIGEE